MAKIKISTELLQSCEHKVRQKYKASGRSKETLYQLFADLMEARIQNENDALDLYFSVLFALELNRTLQSIKDRDQSKLLELAETCLGFCQIRPVTSHHSHLYLRLYQAMAQNSALAGQAWDSTVQIMVGEYLGRDGRSLDEPSAWLRGQQAWMLGHLRTAKVALHTALISDPDPDCPKSEVAQLLVRVYRLSGEGEEALLQAAALDQAHEWIEILGRIQKGADAKLLNEYLNAHGQELSSDALALCLLWLGACPGREFLKDVGKWKSRRQKEQGWPLVSTLELLYDQSTPLQQRFAILGRKLNGLNTAEDPECALLFLACAVRWLLRIKQLTFASVVHEEYRTQSLRLSEGRSVDVLGVMRDMTEGLPVVVSKEAFRGQQKFYTGTTPRFLKIAQTMARCSLQIARLYLRNLEPDAFTQQQKVILLAFMKDFEMVLGELKGPAMKVAQMIAANYFADKDMQAIMQNIHDDAQPLPMPDIKGNLAREWGQPLEAILSDFDEHPVAVASIGQVYRATTRDGTDVAIKFKYPGIEDAIRSDLRLVKLFTPLLRQFIPADHLHEMLAQFTQRFESECDYRQEAANQERFAAAFAGDPTIRIPRVIKELSTDKVLVTEFIEGQRLDHFLENANQDERNEAARKTLRFSLLALLKHGFQHVDPNLANFIVTPDAIAVLDFGACVAIPRELRNAYAAIMMSRTEGLHQELYDQAMALRLFDPKDMPFPEFQASISPSLMAPYAFDEERPFYDEGHVNLPEYFLKKGLTKKVQLDPRYIFTNAGSILGENVIARMGAHLNWHRLARQVLAEVSEPQTLPADESSLPAKIS